MIVNQANLEAIYKSFKTLFNEAFAAAKPFYTKVATIVPSSTKSEEYKWLGQIPRLRKWVGDRIIQNLMAHGWTIKNEPWESSVAVDRDDIDDDTIGVYIPIVKSMGDAAATHPDEIIAPLFHDGFLAKCYDGQYFFDTDHPGPKGVSQINKGTAKFSATEYGNARAAMRKIKDLKGKYLHIRPDLLVVSGKNEELARQVLNADRIEGTTNVWKNSADLLVIDELADYPEEWFLLSTKGPVKPLIFQVRKKANFVALDKETDENVFMRKEFIYGVDCRDNSGYGLWQLAYGSDGTAT